MHWKLPFLTNLWWQCSYFMYDVRDWFFWGTLYSLSITVRLVDRFQRCIEAGAPDMLGRLLFQSTVVKEHRQYDSIQVPQTSRSILPTRYKVGCTLSGTEMSPQSLVRSYISGSELWYGSWQAHESITGPVLCGSVSFQASTESLQGRSYSMPCSYVDS